VTTQEAGFEERGPQPPLPRDYPATPEVRDDETTTVPRLREPLEVPVVYATIEPLTWEGEDQINETLRSVTVEANLAVPETVSVSLSPFKDGDSAATAGHFGMVFFDLKPMDALALADELRLAAEEAVVPCRCGRTLATMGDHSDTCLFNEQQAT
jgi:hypothetical protein